MAFINMLSPAITFDGYAKKEGCKHRQHFKASQPDVKDVPKTIGSMIM